MGNLGRNYSCFGYSSRFQLLQFIKHSNDNNIISGDPSIKRDTFYVEDTEAYNSISPLDTFLDVVRFVLVLIRLK